MTVRYIVKTVQHRDCQTYEIYDTELKLSPKTMMLYGEKEDAQAKCDELNKRPGI